MRYILRTEYNSVFRHDDSPGGSCNQKGLKSILAHFNTKFVIMPDWPCFGCILYDVFGEGSNSVIVSGRLANLSMISEEHGKNDEILFQNV